MRVWYVAACTGCDARPKFGDYEERARWVGEHRVTTGPHVNMYLEKP
jgi:hypothetical protein